jgi:recombinational DNA repair ATPase RecF
MKILRLCAHNIKRLQAIDITPPDEPVILISGRNDQGKSSALDSIQLALDADSLKKAVTVPLRHGAHHGDIALDLGEGQTVQVEVSRTYTENGTSYLNVWADGEKIKSPQAFLDALNGALSFDPHAFAKMEPTRQHATLLELVHLDVELAVLDAEYADTFETRTSVNRDLKQQEAVLAKIAVPAPDLPTSELSAAAILAAIQAAQDTRLQNATQRQQLTALRDEATAAKKGLDDLEQTIRDLETRLQAVRAEREEKQQAYTALLTRGRELAATVRILVDPDLSPLQEQLTTIEERKEAIRTGQKYRTQTAEVARLQRESTALTAQLERIKDTKDTALRQAKFPIEGLGFSEAGVTFNGLPFHQAASSQQLRISLAIAMALNPTLRVIRIPDGSLLDDENMEIIRSMAREKDYQIWIEVVGHKVGIQIEDGLVKGAPIPEPETRRTRRRQTAEEPAASTPPDGPSKAPTTTPSSNPTRPLSPQHPAKPIVTGLAAVAPPLPRPAAASANSAHTTPIAQAAQPPAASAQGSTGALPPTSAPLRTPVYAKRTAVKPTP